MTRTKIDDKSIQKLLIELVTLTSEDLVNGKFVHLTKQLWEADEYIIYSFIKFLIKNYQRTGILKSYRRTELLGYFKWEETQLDHYLKQAVKQNVLIHAKQKYSLNLENILVKRIWDFYFKTTNLENFTSTEMVDIASFIKKKQTIENEIQALKLFIESENQIRNNKIFTEFVEEIRNIMYESDGDPKDPLLDLCEKKLQKLIE